VGFVLCYSKILECMRKPLWKVVGLESCWTKRQVREILSRLMKTKSLNRGSTGFRIVLEPEVRICKNAVLESSYIERMSLRSTPPAPENKSLKEGKGEGLSEEFVSQVGQSQFIVFVIGNL
jgi:hypothetical protein